MNYRNKISIFLIIFVFIFSLVLSVDAGTITLNNAPVSSFKGERVYTRTKTETSRVGLIVNLANTGNVVDSVFFRVNYGWSSGVEMASLVATEGGGNTTTYYYDGITWDSGTLIDIHYRSNNWNLGSYTINGFINYK